MEPLYPVTLTGRFVRLEPFTVAHAAPLAEAAAEPRATFALTFVPESLADMERYVNDALVEAEKKQLMPFATVDAVSGRVVGATSFCALERWMWRGLPRPEPAPLDLDALEIGRTWLCERAQRTVINSEAKLLMLRHAFETWRVYRVTLKTDARNQRSRDAIARLGAKFDGILRGQMAASDGTIRDSAWYSMLRAEWPAARERLQARILPR